MKYMQNAFVNGNPTSHAENQHGDDQRPEVEFFTIAEGMEGVGGFLASSDTEQQ
jgi:hypothetical protein